MTTPHATATQETGTPEQESRFHTYSSHVIPWYVRFIWLLFWIFAIGYVV